MAKTKRGILLWIITWCITTTVSAQTDSLNTTTCGLKQMWTGAMKLLKSFSEVDSNYVVPQQYNCTFMLQNTNTFEHYRLSNSERQSIKLAPQPTIRIGPYVGYSFIVLGYTFDIKNLNVNKQKREIDLSLYSARIGLDLFYRQTGNNYEIRNLYLGENIDTQNIRGATFDGFQALIKGFNAYYILNHRKFSYPAAFSQSTIQRHSAGSMLVGIGYTNHRLNIDLAALEKLVVQRLGKDILPPPSDESKSLEFGNFEYSDISLSGGYGYNWVFAKDFLFASSLSLGLGYKKSFGDLLSDTETKRDFNFKNFNVDAIGRFAIVYNNMKWYAGASTIFHSYNYNKNKFSTNTIFGNLNFYIGFNFGKIKK